MAHIFLLRHGETEGNERQIFRGRWDLPLNTTGRRQASLAGEALKSISFSSVFTSPLLRARETAAEVAPNSTEIAVEESLIDIDYGDWTKMQAEDVADEYPRQYRTWHHDPANVVFPGGERLADVRARIERFLSGLDDRAPDQNILLISHRVPIKVALCVSLGLADSAFWRITADTASISIINLRGGSASLISCNETGHLQTFASKLDAIDF